MEIKEGKLSKTWTKRWVKNIWLFFVMLEKAHKYFYLKVLILTAWVVLAQSITFLNTDGTEVSSIEVFFISLFITLFASGIIFVIWMLIIRPIWRTIRDSIDLVKAHNDSMYRDYK